MHRILERQIKRYLGEHAAIPPEWGTFFESVSRTYTDFDEDRALLDRSLELSSKEFLENNRRLEDIRVKVEDQAQNLALQVAKRTKDLNGRIVELEDVRKAMTNLLEDFREEQKALAEAKAKDEAILASIADGCIVVNEKGKIILINQVAQKMLGYTSKESIGKQWHEVLHREDESGNPVSSEQGAIRAALSITTTEEEKKYTASSPKIIPGIYYYIRKDKTKFPVAITVAPVVLENKFIGAIEVFRDITKEREIEKLRVDFLSLASHQLRTPLSGTKWLIDTMRGEILGSMTQKQKEYLEYIYQINERMIRLVSDMLNVLMLESGVVVMEKQEFSVSKLYEELLLMMEPAARSKRVTIYNALKKQKKLFIQSNFQALRSILETFVSNAINYSQNEQKVILGAKEEYADIVFSVKDSGIGIPKEEQKRIAERFYRASNAKTFKPDGTGLGLYIAFMLAQKVGGKINFESEENKGTIFYLRVPKKVDSGSNFSNK